MIVPAVTEVSFPQAAHSQLAQRRFSSQPLSWPQAGQTKPSGQRLAARCRAQEASSGKRASKAARDMGRSYFQRLAMTEHYTNMLPTPTRNSTSRQTGLKGISPFRLFLRPPESPWIDLPVVAAPVGMWARRGAACPSYPQAARRDMPRPGFARPALRAASRGCRSGPIRRSGAGR